MAGRFIVLEGIDGAGTTTHTARLASSLKVLDEVGSSGAVVHGTREPSDGPVGMLLRQVLSGRVVAPGPEGHSSFDWRTMGLLFAADRLDHLHSEVLPLLAEGGLVVSDRYDHSSLAYQSAAVGGDPEAVRWLRELNAHARRPDLTILLDLPVEVARARCRARSGPEDLYEKDALQRRIAGFYLEIEQHFPGERIVRVDADRRIEEVAAEILQHARSVFEA